MACVGRCEPFLFFPLRCLDFSPAPHYGGARYVRTIAAGQRFAVLRAAADAAIADYVCSRCFVGRFVLKI